MTAVYEKLLRARKERGGGFLLLIDPDRGSLDSALALLRDAESAGVDGVLVGTSFMFKEGFEQALQELKSVTNLPLILFPGSASQVCRGADAILFMSLISGRNAQYLIDEQVKGAPLVSAYGIEPIPTGYMLIESGSYTSVEYVSNTRPIPRTKSDLAVAHALAAQHLGMKMIYLEAGSGAQHAVPDEMISAVKKQLTIPVIVGGGIASPEEAALKISAGADFVVIGTRFESPENSSRLAEFAQACHPTLATTTAN